MQKKLCLITPIFLKNFTNSEISKDTTLGTLINSDPNALFIKMGRITFVRPIHEVMKVFLWDTPTLVYL